MSEILLEIGKGVLVAIILGGISWGAKIAYKRLRGPKASKQLESIVKETISEFCKHPYLSTSDQRRWETILNNYIQNHAPLDSKDKEEQELIDLFEERVAENQEVHNYLKSLWDRNGCNPIRKDIQELLNEHTNSITNIVREQGFDPRDIKPILESLPPLKEGKERVECEIQKLYEKREIDVTMKELLLLITDVRIKDLEIISKEEQRQRECGNIEVANTLKSFLEIEMGTSSRTPKDIYNLFEQELQEESKNLEEQQNQKRIKVLTQAIHTSLNIFSCDEACTFHEKLIAIAPTAEHHFKYAYLLQDLNKFEKTREHYEKALELWEVTTPNDLEIYWTNRATILNNLAILLNSINDFENAKKHYREALKIRRTLAKINPKAHRPDVASTLNNLAVLLNDLNDFENAKKHYREALKIRRTLAKESPKAYLSDVAMTLYNLGNLFKDLDNFETAKKYYEEALEIYKKLAEENPKAYRPDVAMTLSNLVEVYNAKGKQEKAEQAYEEAIAIQEDLAKQQPDAYAIDYARMLLMGVYWLNKPLENLQKAKEILQKYPNIPKAQQLLNVAERIEKKRQ